MEAKEGGAASERGVTPRAPASPSRTASVSVGQEMVGRVGGPGGRRPKAGPRASPSGEESGSKAGESGGLMGVTEAEGDTAEGEGDVHPARTPKKR